MLLTKASPVYSDKNIAFPAIRDVGSRDRHLRKSNVEKRSKNWNWNRRKQPDRKRRDVQWKKKEEERNCWSISRINRTNSDKVCNNYYLLTCERLFHTVWNIDYNIGLLVTLVRLKMQVCIFFLQSTLFYLPTFENITKWTTLRPV